MKRIRFIPAEEAYRSWGCRYYTEVIPGEDYTRQQYLSLKETELKDKNSIKLFLG
ncbi:MAG: hypothetical protein ABSC17_10135 [Thermacetogeniaceae bacterium]